MLTLRMSTRHMSSPSWRRRPNDARRTTQRGKGKGKGCGAFVEDSGGAEDRRRQTLTKVIAGPGARSGAALALVLGGARRKGLWRVAAPASLRRQHLAWPPQDLRLARVVGLQGAGPRQTPEPPWPALPLRWALPYPRSVPVRSKLLSPPPSALDSILVPPPASFAKAKGQVIRLARWGVARTPAQASFCIICPFNAVVLSPTMYVRVRTDPPPRTASRPAVSP